MQIAQRAIQAQAIAIGTTSSRGWLAWIMIHNGSIMLMVCGTMLLVIRAGHGPGIMQQGHGRAGKQQCQGSKPCSDLAPDVHHHTAA